MGEPRFTWRSVLCWLGWHDMHAWAEGREREGPPEGHECYPGKTDGPHMLVRKFQEWTRLRCTRCRRTYP